MSWSITRYKTTQKVNWRATIKRSAGHISGGRQGFTAEELRGFIREQLEQDLAEIAAESYEPDEYSTGEHNKVLAKRYANEAEYKRAELKAEIHYLDKLNVKGVLAGLCAGKATAEFFKRGEMYYPMHH